MLTGSTSGLGLGVVNDLTSLPAAQRPKLVIQLARSRAKADAAASKLLAAGIESNEVIGDLSRPREVFRMVKEVKALSSSIDILVINAGMFSKESTRQVQEDNLEQHFALNYLHQPIVINGLMNELSKPASSRICIMGSYTSIEFAKGQIDFPTLHSPEGDVNGMIPSALVYSRAKLAQHMWAKHASTLLPKSTTINVACPGNVPSTNLDTWTELRAKMPRFVMPAFNWLLASRTVEVGVQPMMFIMGSSYMESKTGLFTDWSWKKKDLQYFEPKPMEFYHNGAIAASVSDPAQCARLYNETEALIVVLNAKAATKGVPVVTVG